MEQPAINPIDVLKQFLAWVNHNAHFPSLSLRDVDAARASYVQAINTLENKKSTELTNDFIVPGE